MDAIYTGQRIAELRRAAGLTQKEMAERLHVSPAAVSKWERGLNFPDLVLLEPLAELLGVSAAALLGIENEPAEAVIRGMTEISEKEREAMRESLWRRIGLILLLMAALFAAVLSLSGSIHRLDGNPNGLLNGLPLLVGFASWVLAGASVTSGRKTYTTRWKNYSAASLACCALALYFPLLTLDLHSRLGHWSTIQDTAWGYNFGALALLLGTAALNICSWIINRRRQEHTKT